MARMVLTPALECHALQMMMEMTTTIRSTLEAIQPILAGAKAHAGNISVAKHGSKIYVSDINRQIIIHTAAQWSSVLPFVLESCVRYVRV